MASRKSSTASKKKASTRSKGLGDTVEKVTKATGIKDAVDWFSEKTGVDCGCDKRKEKLNKMFRYSKPECLTKDEYDFIRTIEDKETLTFQDTETMNAIYKRVFNKRVKRTTCASCLNGRRKELLAVASTYEQDQA